MSSKNQQNTCKAINKNGNRCKNRKYSNSNYCYLHSFTHKTKVKFYKNPKIHFGMTILGLILAIYFGSSSATKENQQIIIANQDTTTSDLQKIRELLLESMAKIQRQRENEFLKFYDLGYQLVAFDRYSNVIPYNSRIRSDFIINWNKTKLERVGQHELKLTLPTITTHGNMNYSGSEVSFSEGTLGLVARDHIFDYDICVEVIDYRVYGYICLIGLKNVTF